jgi:hypothetical protein
MATQISPGRPGRRTAKSCDGHDTTIIMQTKGAYPGTNLWATDVCVPISRLAECTG